MKFKFTSAKNRPHRASGPVLRMAAICRAMPHGELIDTHEMAARLGYVGRMSVCHHSSNRLLDDYRHLIHRSLWWGNKKTIAALRKQFP